MVFWARLAAVWGLIEVAAALVLWWPLGRIPWGLALLLGGCGWWAYVEAAERLRWLKGIT